MVAAAQFTTRLVAGIPVPNTALINSSIALARANLPDPALNHVMRAWLVGQAIINRLPSESRSKVDEEAFGIAAILHDIGLYKNPLVPIPSSLAPFILVSLPI